MTEKSFSDKVLGRLKAVTKERRREERRRARTADRNPNIRRDHRHFDPLPGMWNAYMRWNFFGLAVIAVAWLLHWLSGVSLGLAFVSCAAAAIFYGLIRAVRNAATAYRNHIGPRHYD